MQQMLLIWAAASMQIKSCHASLYSGLKHLDAFGLATWSDSCPWHVTVRPCNRRLKSLHLASPCCHINATANKLRGIREMSVSLSNMICKLY